MMNKNYPLRDDGSFNYGLIYDQSRPFPQITFRVKTYNESELFACPQPVSDRNEQLRLLQEQTVWVEFWPYPLKNGDLITLYGEKAIHVYENIYRWSQLEIAYYGTPFQPTPTPTPPPTIQPHQKDIAYNEGEFLNLNGLNNFSITFNASIRNSNFNKISFYSNNGFIFPSITWSLSYFTNSLKNRLNEIVETVYGPNVVCVQIAENLFEYTFTFNQLAESLNKSYYNGSAVSNEYTLSTTSGFNPNQWFASLENNYTTNQTAGFNKASPEQLPDQNGNYVIFSLKTDTLLTIPTPTPTNTQPTATPTPTTTSSPTPTPSISPTVTASPTPTATPLPTPYGKTYISGYNNFGQMASNNVTAYQVLTSYLNKNIWDVNTVNHVSFGRENTYIIRSDGTLWATGNGAQGRLGNNQVNSQSSPIQIAGTNWACVAGGWYYCTATKTDGTMWSWGQSNNGYLGNGAVSPWPSVSSPVQVGSGNTWPTQRGKMCSGQHTLAVKTDGTLWGWGRGTLGQLGNDSTNNSNSPVQIGSDNTWGYATVSRRDDTTGQQFSAAVKTDGTLWMWGHNTDGVLGQNLSIASLQGTSSPVQVGSNNNWKWVKAGNGNVWAVKTDNTLWGWGNNFYGQLGQNNNIHRSSPVQITGSTFNFTDIDQFSISWRHGLVTDVNEDLYFTGENVWGEGALGYTGNKNVLTQVSSNKYFKKVYADHASTFVLAVPYVPEPLAGQLWAWGVNYPYGNFGNNSMVDSYSPVQVSTSTFYQIPQSANNTFHYIKADGTLWGWGSNSGGGGRGGQIGDNSIIDRSMPVQIGSATDWRSVFTKEGFANIDTSVYALNSTGQLWAWGNSVSISATNFYSPLGDGQYISRSSPVQLAAGTSFSYLGRGNQKAIMMVSDGGQLYGIGQSTNRNLLIANDNVLTVPTLVQSTAHWSKVEVGADHGIGLSNTNTLFAWGNNAYGQLGTNNTTDYNIATNVGLINTWDIISVGDSFSFAIKQDGSLWSWGKNHVGQLGHDNTINYSSPTQIGTENTWTNVIVCPCPDRFTRGYSRVIGLKNDGSLWTWGDNTFGTLGDGTTIHRSSPIQTVLNDNLWISIGINENTTFGLRLPPFPTPQPTPSDTPIPTTTPTPTPT
jgi:alpha-tubulin suppressor-like RCC1 family protein/translation initiation factor IF-1